MIKFIYLKNSFLFAGLADSNISKLADISVLKKFERNSILAIENQDVEGIYIVGSGSAKVYKTSDKGQMLILKIAGPGEALGEVACLLKKPIFPANIEAAEYSEFIFIEKMKLLNLLSVESAISLHLLSNFAEIILSFTKKIGDFTFVPVRSRLLKYLIEKSNEAGNKEFELSETKQTIAARLGTIPETISRVIKTLELDNIIKVDGKKILIR